MWRMCVTNTGLQTPPYSPTMDYTTPVKHRAPQRPNGLGLVVSTTLVSSTFEHTTADPFHYHLPIGWLMWLLLPPRQSYDAVGYAVRTHRCVGDTRRGNTRCGLRAPDRHRFVWSCRTVQRLSRLSMYGTMIESMMGSMIGLGCLWFSRSVDGPATCANPIGCTEFPIRVSAQCS